MAGAYVVIGALVGYAIEGAGMAALMAVVMGAAGLAGMVLAPEVLPPSPAVLPRPAVGDSPSAVRRRRTEGFVALFTGVPIVVACVLLAVVVPAGPWRWIVVAVAVIYSAGIAYAFVLSALSGERIDRIRTRKYERGVARLEADRRLYRELVDPEVEAAKGRRLVRWFLVLLAVQGLIGALAAVALLVSVLL
jgi:hypothetical protein